MSVPARRFSLPKTNFADGRAHSQGTTLHSYPCACAAATTHVLRALRTDLREDAALLPRLAVFRVPLVDHNARECRCARVSRVVRLRGVLRARVAWVRIRLLPIWWVWRRRPVAGWGRAVCVWARLLFIVWEGDCTRTISVFVVPRVAIPDRVLLQNMRADASQTTIHPD